MLDLCHNSDGSALRKSLLANWEEDIEEVAIEPCDEDEDSSGYRVVFYKRCADIGEDLAEAYIIGASFLKKRLRKLRRAGFDAPMTKEALDIIKKSRLRLVS